MHGSYAFRAAATCVVSHNFTAALVLSTALDPLCLCHSTAEEARGDTPVIRNA